MRLPDDLDSAVRSASGLWLITGVAGFIGSNLLEALLERDQRVRGLDNFATGHRRNLDQVRQAIRPEQWSRFEFFEGDIRDAPTCREVCQGVRHVLHQAALGSVPGSLADPDTAHAVNVTGTLQMLMAAREAKVPRVVYASSCAVYGNAATIPIRETEAGLPLSPYAATKLMNEMYAHVFSLCYGLSSVGLRYFNVFGPRQDPEGPYAAVIPKWIAALIQGQSVPIYGDGQSSRDFCYVADVVQANLRAALAEPVEGLNRVYNVASGERVNLVDLFRHLKHHLAAVFPAVAQAQARHEPFRAGDVRHSQADLTEVRRALAYQPLYTLGDGLDASLAWYRANLL